MSYRSKTPCVISILQRKLKPGKTFEDFQEAHLPGGNIKKHTYGYTTDFFGIPTRVINSVDTQDPTIIVSLGFNYGTIDEIFEAATRGAEKDSQKGSRGDKLDEVCDDIAPPRILFVATDNDYGGEGLEYTQKPLAKVTPEVTQAIKEMLNQKPEQEE